MLLHGYKHFNYLTYLQIIKKNTLEKVDILAKLSNSTVFSIIASCYYLIIYSICQKPHVTICYTLSTRNSIQKQKASGSFLNYLFIKQSINENMPAIDFIKSTHQQINQMKINCISSMSKIWKEAGLSEYINIPVNINYFINQRNIISDNVNNRKVFIIGKISDLLLT